MDVLNDDVVKYERPAARASVDGFERPRVAISIIVRIFLPYLAAAAKFNNTAVGREVVRAVLYTLRELLHLHRQSAAVH